MIAHPIGSGLAAEPTPGPRRGRSPPRPGLILLALLAACALPSARAAPGSEACAPSPLREERFDALAPRGELVLASGARLVLAGIRWPQEATEAARAEDWLRGYRGRALAVTAFGGEDRWGRAAAEAVADPEGDDAPVDLAAGLVEAGLAAIDAGEADGLCRADLWPHEARARAAGRGLWRVPPHDARDGVALAALAGRFVVAQGRIVSVGERPARTYLDFAPRGESGLTVTVPKRTWRILQARGLTAAGLRGRLARVRGVVEMRRGPTLDIVVADMIEVPEDGAARTR